MDQTPTVGRRTLVTAGGAAALAALAGCTARALPFGRQRISAEEVERFPVADVETLTVANDVGDVVVGVGDVDAVEVGVLKRANDRETLDRIGVETHLDDGALSVRTTYPDGYLRRAEDGPRTDVTVLFPASGPGPTVESVTSVVGDVTVRDVRGDARLRSRVGAVLADRVDGYVHLRTEVGDVEATDCTGLDGASAGTGAVKVELLGIRGDTLVESGVGKVVVGVDPALDLHLRAEGVAVDVDLPLADRSGGGGTGLVAGRLNGGGPLLRVRADLGDVDVTTLE